MIGVVTLDDKDGNAVTLHAEDGKRMLNRAQGLTGISPVRTSVRVRPTAHGGINRSRWTDGSLVVLEGEVFSPVSIEDAFTEFDAIVKPMIDTLETGPALLKWQRGSSGEELQKLVKLHSEVEPVHEGGAPVITYQAQFYAEDPRAYTQAVTTAEASIGITGGGKGYVFDYQRGYAASSGGVVAVVNAGTRDSPPVLRLHGAWTDVTVLLLGTQRQIALTGTVNEGDYLEIDGATHTMTINGVTAANEYLDAANTRWFDIPRGTQTLRTTALAAGDTAVLEVLYRSAY